MDEFKIKNYKNKSVLVSDLLNYAQHYIDTVKTVLPVSHVDFVGEKNNQQLPEDPANDRFNTERKQLLIGFGFSSFLSENEGKKSELYDISISRNGRGKIYYLKFQDDKRVIDSVLNSKQPFDNNF